MNPSPETRFYQVRVPARSEWARIWITDDGCITTISDHGNYGYWFGAPGGEFRRFLIGCNDDYLSNKFSGGKREIDEHATERGVKERICRLRRAGRLSREEAADEWELQRSTSWTDAHDQMRWYNTTRLDDAAEVLVHRCPIQVTMFFKVLWPLFVEKLKAELRAEAFGSVAV